jgi:predicted short-subunit dehydrogenase-like oxidoreductase (DUF2520 family)
MLPAMKSKPMIAIVGPGRLGNALALELKRTGFRIAEIVSRDRASSRKAARALAKKVGAKAVTAKTACLQADVVWFMVSDRDIAAVAKELALKTSWKGKMALHSSGALSSDELDLLRKRGASVASVHPFMTFVSRSAPSLKNVPFGIEGDAAGVRVAKQIVRGLGGEAFVIPRNKKAAYHAWGGFTSPLLLSLLVTAEQVAARAGFSRAEARRWAMPIVLQTVVNYVRLGPDEAFSGPIVRGDAAVVRKHLEVLKAIPVARDVYVALARAALGGLPARNREEIERALRGK